MGPNGRGLSMAPPLSITTKQADDMIERIDATLTEWEEAMTVG